MPGNFFYEEMTQVGWKRGIIYLNSDPQQARTSIIDSDYGSKKPPNGKIKNKKLADTLKQLERGNDRYP